MLSTSRQSFCLLSHKISQHPVHIYLYIRINIIFNLIYNVTYSDYKYKFWGLFTLSMHNSETTLAALEEIIVATCTVNSSDYATT